MVKLWYGMVRIIKSVQPLHPLADMTSFDGSDDSLDRFLAFSLNSLEQYQWLSEGMMIADCKKRPNDGGEMWFRVALIGSPNPPFYFSLMELQKFDDYVSLRFTTIQEPYPLCCWLINILEVFKSTGYGFVVLKFEHARKGTTLLRVFKTTSEQYHLSNLPDSMR